MNNPNHILPDIRHEQSRKQEPDMPSILAHIALESGKNSKYSVIWLHGLGADGNDFAPIVDEFKLPVAVRYIFPHAPHIPVTINGGSVMRAWYDISVDDLSTELKTGISTGLKTSSSAQAADIRASQAAVEALIAQEIKHGRDSQHIFLAGFSQGGAIALHTALRRSEPLAGVLALSTYLPLADAAITEACSRQTPIFMAHGLQDPVVPCALGRASRDALLALGYSVAWHEYPMQHSVNGRELSDIEAWLTERIAKCEAAV
jgi:phospholipase/carboxylesterase